MSGVRAFYFPSHESRVDVVFVPLVEGIERLRRVDDLNFSQWCKREFSPERRVIVLDDLRYKVKNFPFSSYLKLPNPFTVVWGTEVCLSPVTILSFWLTAFQRVRNSTLVALWGHALSAQMGVTFNTGDLIVVKEDANGLPIDVQEEDKQLVIRIVLRCVMCF